MRVPFARSKAPPAAPPPGHAAPCTNCAAPMDVGQDWCLACGTAVPGRFGGGPGLRSSLGVVGVTLLLVVGAVAAAYAALNSDSKQATQTVATVPAQTPATPDLPAVTTTPASVPVAPLPSTTTVPTPTTVTTPTTPKLPPATPTPAAAPVAPVTTTTPATTKTTPTSTVTTPAATTPTATTPAAKSATILLDTDAASTYNPYSLPTASFGDPSKAIDGDTTTSWTYQLDPSTAGKTLFGLAIDLKSKQQVRALSFATTTPGMTVEFYGATGTEPVSITDPAWIHLANRRQIKASTKIALKTQGKAFDHLLVWITHAPVGMTTGTLGISELSVST